ncbi:unnamed protein product [Bursaphelenchus okinawaensis]|uniref:ARID domain-containing protein n=1 Tax=Bursaphelenchus okinawaensis TaxID=465554 RepID=A0A811JVR0_9BILA|nr:unnamed protein product [Bursaphelenchus okinawaensis]CAG9085405.1 unnamed protein product [Bursaphelenchus okinawaensis]
MSSAEGAAEQPAHEQRLEQPQQHQQQATLQIAAGAAPAAPGTPQNVQHSPGQRRPPMQWPPKSDAGDQPQMPPYLPPGYPPQAYWPPQARFMYPEGQQPPQQPGFPGHPYYLQVPQQQFLSNQQHPQTSTADEGEKANTNPPQQSPHHPHYNINMQRPMPAGQPPMMMAQQPPQPQQYPPSANAHLLKPVQREAVDKLVGVPTELVPPSVMPQRRDFFEQLVLLNEQHNETLTAPPQVSKSPVDLHRLYIAVRKAGGFKKVCDDKSWKGLCREANPSMTESSAAGYQLRRHYQKYLLALECRETGADMSELIAYAEKLKKKKKEKEPVPGGPSSVGQPGQPGTPAPAHNPPTPNSIRSAVTPTPAAATPGPPAQATPVSAAAADQGRRKVNPPLLRRGP